MRPLSGYPLSHFYISVSAFCLFLPSIFVNFIHNYLVNNLHFLGISSNIRQQGCGPLPVPYLHRDNA